MSEQATGLFDRALYPLFSIDEVFERRKSADGNVETAKEKIAEIIRNNLKIFNKVHIISTGK